jgi:competence protein ComEC
MCWWGARTQPLRLTMLDVGQGESLVLRTPAGRTILVDGGGTAKFEREDVGRTVIVPFLESNGIRKLDALVLTHADADHCNGLQAVVREVPISLFVDGGHSDDVSAVEYIQLRRAIALKNIPVVEAHAGEKLDTHDGAMIDVLAPLSPPIESEHSDNDNGAVLKVKYGKTSLLLTADIEEPAEERLEQRGLDLKCTVLKVGHHGSNSSTHEELLSAAQPQIALISCGRYNKYGHPRPEVLRRLASHKVSTFRTDVNGAIEVACNGEACWVQTVK